MNVTLDDIIFGLVASNEKYFGIFRSKMRQLYYVSSGKDINRFAGFFGWISILPEISRPEFWGLTCRCWISVGIGPITAKLWGKKVPTEIYTFPKFCINRMNDERMACKNFRSITIGLPVFVKYSILSWFRRRASTQSLRGESWDFRTLRSYLLRLELRVGLIRCHI